MTTSKMTLGKLVDDRRFRMAGIAFAVVMGLTSVGFLVAARNVGSKNLASSMKAVLPDHPYDLPIVRYLPRAQSTRNRIIDSLPDSSHTIARR